MPMSTEIKKGNFDSLPSRVKAGLLSIDREPSMETELFLKETIPALNDKSILQTLSDTEDGAERVVAYCNTVKGKFF